MYNKIQDTKPLITYSLIPKATIFTCQDLKIGPQLKNMTKQFDKVTWLAILLSFAIVCASTVVRKQCSRARSAATLLKLLAPILNTSSGSGVNESHKTMTLKTYLQIISASWLLMTIIINNVYQIIVISDLIEPVPPKNQWNIFEEIPSKISKVIVLDESILTLENQINITYLNITYHQSTKTNMCVLALEHLEERTYFFHGAHIPWQHLKVCVRSILYTESLNTILTWHLSPFGRYIRDKGLKCVGVFENRSALTSNNSFNTFCRETAGLLLSMRPQLSANLTNLFQSIRSNCSNSVFIDHRENVDLVTKHLNELAGRKLILQGRADQSKYTSSSVWMIHSYFGHKHILKVRLERFLESGILGYIKSVLKSYRERHLKKEGTKVPAEAKPLDLNGNIVLIFYVHLFICGFLILVALIKRIEVDFIGIVLYVSVVVPKFLPKKTVI